MMVIVMATVAVVSVDSVDDDDNVMMNPHKVRTHHDGGFETTYI